MTGLSPAMADEVLPPRNIAAMPDKQRLYWSLRREIWEHRVIWVMPALTGIVVLVAFVMTLPELPQRVSALTGPDPMIVEGRIQNPYIWASLAISASVFLVAVFYCLEALQGERRDRSMLFWKSMPVSDRMTVVSKAMIPLAVLPVVAAATCLIVHAIMLMSSCAFLLAEQGDVRTFLAHLRFIDLTITALYTAIVLAWWHAPIYGWLLFLSSWAGRAVVVWAFGPFLALWAAESTGLSTSKLVVSTMRSLLGGWLDVAFSWPRNVGSTSFVEPALTSLLRTSHIWIGSVFVTICVAGAVYMRRRRETN